ncbi:beta,beta-carotene 15,15'-monooxygenase [Plakobranchus ocellatus]|uniref:Beta,beta-carotene 15,15'-monooxygenase n=1 Tax=Plakobranchus ocellatus TaxID=259542 RepID=A0AAV4ABD4_9GAST|nr:beta,beta-carotene 15,15'-monooxygenase [Plakobranchus ocellatus]
MAVRALHGIRWSVGPMAVCVGLLFLLSHPPHCLSLCQRQKTGLAYTDSRLSLSDEILMFADENQSDITSQASESSPPCWVNYETLSEDREDREENGVTALYTDKQSRRLNLNRDNLMGTKCYSKKNHVRSVVRLAWPDSKENPQLFTNKVETAAAAAAAVVGITQADQIVTPQVQEEGYNLLFTSNPAEMVDVPITFGKLLPSWLNGTLVRNGLGKFENGPRKFIHAFDGFAKLASWRFTGSQTAFFSTKFIRSDFYKDSTRYRTIAPYLLFQNVTPPFSLFEKLQCLIRGIDNMNVNIYAFKNVETKNIEFAALSDFWISYKVSVLDLSTEYRVVPKLEHSQKSGLPELGGIAFLNLLSSAHPLPEPGTENHLTFLSSVAFIPWEDHLIKLVRMKSIQHRQVIAQWSVARIPYMHSFSVTGSKAILLASPFFVNVACMLSQGEPFACLDWHPELPTTLYVVDLTTGNLVTISMDTVFTMHHVNAYDLSDTKIVMDISSYPSPHVIAHLQLHVLKDPVARNSFDIHAKLQRIIIDLRGREAHLSPIDQRPVPGIASLLDMPVINEAFRSRRYCFVYGIVVKADNVNASKMAVVKKDVCHNDKDGGGAGDRIWKRPNIYPTEPWFVANPRAAGEDDGLLLIPVLDGVKQTSSLVVLDAKTMTAVSSANLPTVVPFSLHEFGGTEDSEPALRSARILPLQVRAPPPA